MGSKLAIRIAAALGLAMASPAHAEPPRQVFCIAVRTVPQLDQDNYVMGADGPVYVTPNFSTDMGDDDLIPRWRAFITARHPTGYPSNPDDTCHPANTRREVMRAQHGNITNKSVAWTPTLAR